MADQANALSKTVAVVGLIATLIGMGIPIGTLFYQAGMLQSRLTQLESNAMSSKVDNETLKQITQAIDKRSAENKIVFENVKENLNELKSRLARMEEKLDRLANRGN